MIKQNPLSPFLNDAGFLTIDGGLATELEARGHDLTDKLWSARLLLDNPNVIRQLHYDYLSSGADCIISASYQATISGFVDRGLHEQQAADMLRLAVSLATEARDAFWSEPGNRMNRQRPIVAASIGPYGAALADGSEYTGDYDLDQRGLVAFHSRRWQILADTQADILACETIPSFPELRALITLLNKSPNRFAWFSFSCRDENRINDGTRIIDCAKLLNENKQVAAIGINYTAPRYIGGLIDQVRSGSDKPIVVYPNSGEHYDAVDKRWTGTSDAGEFAELSGAWFEAGAALIGGCCRTGPEHIRLIQEKLSGLVSPVQ